MKKIIVIVAALLIGVSTMYGAVQDLQNREKDVQAQLTELWIDKDGETHAGYLDPKLAQFAFSESLLSRFTIDQLRGTMKTAISKFDAAKQKAFADEVEPYLKQLSDIKAQIKADKDKMEAMAATLAQYLGKTSQDIMKLADTNIRNLISKLPQEKKIELGSKIDLKEFNALRTSFAVKTTEVPTTTTEASEATKPKSSAGAKVAAAADAVAKSETKLSGLIKASASIAQVWTCTDIHYDIIPGDEPGSVIFLRLVK